MPSDRDQLKRAAAQAAVAQIASGMVVGLGHGSTAHFALVRLAELLATGQLKEMLGVPCSQEVAKEAAALGIPLTSLAEHPLIDLTIDGADEVDPDSNLIKGGGGALLREKMVAQASRREVIIVDESKLSPCLGTNWGVPLEVVEFGWQSHLGFLADLGGKAALRRDQERKPFRTDQGNLILDCSFGPIPNPAELAARLEKRAGLVEHGLFIGLAHEVIIAGPQGVRSLKKG
ncbi:MAG: ribose-5-phosphate isomerase RpiA [Desulfarculaceae bacterium]|jgi:ribose 5-phosphate isomerase A